MKIRYTARAKADLDEIYNHVSQESLRAASRILFTIRKALQGLTDNPELGRPGRVDGTRELVVPGLPYIAAYRIHKAEVQVLAIIHAARLWPGGFPLP